MTEPRTFGVLAEIRQPMGGPIFRAIILQDWSREFDEQDAFSHFLLNYEGKSFYTGGNLLADGNQMNWDDSRYQQELRRAFADLTKLAKEKGLKEIPVEELRIDLVDLKVIRDPALYRRR